MSVEELHHLNAQLLIQIQSKWPSLTFCVAAFQVTVIERNLVQFLGQFFTDLDFVMEIS